MILVSRTERWSHLVHFHVLKKWWKQNPEAHFTKILWAHNWNLVTIDFCSNLDSYVAMRSQFCTCHDSSAVVACAKLWLHWATNFHARSTLFFTRFGLWAHDCLWNGSLFYPSRSYLDIQQEKSITCRHSTINCTSRSHYIVCQPGTISI